MDEVFEYRTEKAIVRIHPGPGTESERRAHWEESARRLFRETLKRRAGNETTGR